MSLWLCLFAVVAQAQMVWHNPMLASENVMQNQAFTEEIHVYDVNWDTLDADMDAVTERQEKLQNKGGNVTPSLTVDEEVQTPETEEEPVKEEEPVEETAEPVEAEKAEVEVVEEAPKAEAKDAE